MKRILIIACAAAALSACASGGYGGFDGGYRGAVGYDAFYDDAYGPFYDGYWGSDGGFYYRSGPSGRFLRDQGNHFRHDQPGGGFHGVHGHGGDHHGR